jgi:hypothetical protein
MDVPDRCAPQADFGRYAVRRDNEAVAALPRACTKSEQTEGRRRLV